MRKKIHIRTLLLLAVTCCLSLSVCPVTTYADETGTEESEDPDSIDIDLSAVDAMSYDASLYASSTSPGNLKVSNGNGRVTISWNSVSTSTQYRVFYRSDSLTTGWQILCDTYNPSVISHLLSSSEPVYYSVRTLTTKKAADPDSSSLDQTAVMSIYTPYAAFSSVSSSADGVAMKWVKNPSVSYYAILRKTKGSSYTQIATVQNNYYDKGSTAGSYLDRTAKSGQLYYYSLRAYSSYNNINYAGSYQSAGTKGLYLSTPKLTSCSYRNQKVVLKWKAITGAKEYHIYRRTKNGSFRYVGKTVSTTFADTKAKKGHNYYYTVRAFSGDFKSGYDKTGTKILCS